MLATLVQRAQAAIGYTFKNPDLLEAAITHASYADTRVLSNERLEFLGDSILGMVVCEELYRRFPDLLEGELTKIKSAVVSRRTCAKIARQRQLDVCVLLGKGMAEQRRLPGSVTAAVYESLIAAVYFDGGLNAAREFILADMTAHIEAAAASENQQNFKSHLQQHAQKNLDATPIYEVLDEKGPDHNKSFEVRVVIADRVFQSDWGPCKKDAEQKAALNALKELEIVPSDETHDAEEYLEAYL